MLSLSLSLSCNSTRHAPKSLELLPQGYLEETTFSVLSVLFIIYEKHSLSYKHSEYSKKTGHIIKHITRNKFSKGGLIVFVSRGSEEDDSF